MRGFFTRKFDEMEFFLHNKYMKYSINCGYCAKEISVSGKDDKEGMKSMIEEAKAHNELRHPDEKEMTKEELDKDIRGKWKRGEMD